ncbi:sialin-like isoform X2 [Coccinella septempunctata]|uniref:sialin-like isoform X2 n=1 Tax=Coccinella septempunctata TaxID=41139 RepID=UPI001D0955F5|nr:sialin-like isoform X2 [Coccinella septempunctata]
MLSNEDETSSWKFWRKRRYVVATMAFFGFFMIYALRVNLSIAIVAMTENKTLVLENGTISYTREFDWDSTVQGYVLSSFFYGYITTQLIGGWFAMRIGGKRLYGVGVAATAVLTLATPLAANMGVTSLILLRVLEGVFEGVTYPCIHAVWSQWAPPLERSRLATIAFTGSYAGTVVSMPACALLAKWFGWPSIFYVFGIVGIFWYSLWVVLISERPSEDPLITDAELRYITESLGENAEKRIKYPWKSIFTSMPVWSIVIAHFSENWGFYTLLTQLPKYLKDILDFDLAKTGAMAALPYLAMSITLPLSGQLADWLLVKGVFNVTQVRKMFNCGAFISQTVFMMGTAYATSATVSMICLIMAVGLGAFAWAGFSVNHLDIAPTHASVLMGIGNSFATLPGIVSPILSGYIVTTPTKGEWQVVFYVTAAVYLFGCLFYWTFASGEVQSWAKESETLQPSNRLEKIEQQRGIDNQTFQNDDM